MPIGDRTYTGNKKCLQSFCVAGFVWTDVSQQTAMCQNVVIAFCANPSIMGLSNKNDGKA
jgi:hypothetical protein